MPGQFFADASGRERVLIRWDMGMRYIDIEFDGRRLVRLDGPDVLLTSGMQGAAPDGQLLAVTASKATGPVLFHVSHAGQWLHDLPTDYAMHPPVVELVDSLGSTPRANNSQGGLTMDDRGRLMRDGRIVDDTVLQYAGGDRKVDRGSLKTARLWVGILGGLCVLINLLTMLLGLVLVAMSRHTELGLDETTSNVAQTKGLVVLGLGGLMVLLWGISLVQAFRKRPSFGLAKVAIVLSFFTWPIIGWALMYFALKGLAGGDLAVDSIRYNEERAAYLAGTNPLQAPEPTGVAH